MAYDDWLRGLGRIEIQKRFWELGVEHVMVKKLAPNNNSKNQIYLQDDINDVELPMGEFTSWISTSERTGEEEVIYRAPIDLAWLTPGGASPAPRTNLIHYPQYPETRLSGFLQGAQDAPRSLLSHRPGKVFSPDRLMLLGVAGTKVYGLVLPPSSPAAQELTAGLAPHPFARWSIAPQAITISSKSMLAELHGVHRMSPIRGCSIRNGVVVPRADQNSGGTTLETVFGVKPNALSEPDFQGWELKSHTSSKITLMTPGPTGGYLIDRGIEDFMLKGNFGYFSPAKDRYDYTGAHTAVRRPGGRATTHLMVDQLAIHLVHNVTGEVGMTWSKAKLLTKWTAKHALAAYVIRSGTAQDGFTYGPRVGLGVGTSFARFLDAVDLGLIYFDPALHWSSAEGGKWRYQIRVNRNRLKTLYEDFTENDVRTVTPSRRLAELSLQNAGIELPAWVA
ncbi:MvaI/BcnI family restriction endonuclease [Nocardioides piscis]|uniref:MvaI/BcnI restriction endonuclease domain-containing protein n=1 Tax=Nocardioides piscis TaxID=2714938 RepID=A0A6G7YBE4_9ACTN|nr:MvaI/BcnI family restriction endonuclease [Nocardioides piscis]QIK74113.1 hypothetical protein G7071_00330 [Nocardioides piscis]